jgi:hypothetical protein
MFLSEARLFGSKILRFSQIAETFGRVNPVKFKLYFHSNWRDESLFIGIVLDDGIRRLSNVFNSVSEDFKHFFKRSHRRISRD